ncbi:MAG: hypothetical protein WBQ44_16070 [Rhodococcus sp. (in: high G+C Gram-positive bacteria)]
MDGHRAEDLVAHAVNCLVAMVAARHGGVTPAVALPCREGWGSDEHALLDAAFDRTGLHGVQLVSHDAAKGAYETVAANGAPVSLVVGLAVGALVVLETGTFVDGDAVTPPAITDAATPSATVTTTPGR